MRGPVGGLVDRRATFTDVAGRRGLAGSPLTVAREPGTPEYAAAMAPSLHSRPSSEQGAPVLETRDKATG